MRQQNDWQVVSGDRRSQSQFKRLPPVHRQTDRGVGDCETGIRGWNVTRKVDQIVHFRCPMVSIAAVGWLFRGACRLMKVRAGT